MANPLHLLFFFFSLRVQLLLLFQCAAAHSESSCRLAGERERRPVLTKHWFMGEPQYSTERSLPIGHM